MFTDARRTATLLGAVGVLPFAVLATASVLGPNDLRARAAFALAAYGATIVSFLGAVHWGLAIRAEMDGGAFSGPALMLGVLPQLAGWGALLLPLRQSLLGLAALVVAVLALDLWSVRKGAAPRWWLPLRVGLSAAAGLGLLVGGLFA